MRFSRTAALVVALVACGVVTTELVTTGQGRGSRPRRVTRPVVVTPWQQVDDALAKGLPKTAIEALGPIIAEALKRKDWPEATRAIALRITLEGEIQGSKAEEKISRMQAELAGAPAEMRPIMEAILAEWTWQFFQQNRWRFVGRTRTESSPGDDITAWDLPRVYAEIDTHFTRALAAAAMLQRTPIEKWDALLVKGNAPDAYRPTLYDFIAHQAIAFYASGEQAGAHPEDAFEIAAESPIFAPPEEFVRWRIATTDSGSPKLAAIHLYQDLLRFHQHDADRSAWLDADLGRLEFGNNVARGESKSDLYRRALERFAARHADHEISARALLAWARLLMAESNPVEARRLAVRGADRFPDSPGGRGCRNLIRAIEQPELDLATERVWNAPPPAIEVSYRNLGHLYFRVVPLDFEEAMKAGGYWYDGLRGEELDALLRRPPTRAWDVDLPETKDFKTRLDSLAIPRGLESGSYYLIASPDARFSKNLPLKVAMFWVSRLAMVARHNDDENLEGLVLDAESGEPIAQALVRSWHAGQGRRPLVGPSATTDADGRFRLRGPVNGFVLHARSGAERVATSDPQWRHPKPDLDPDRRTMFFTDRALYRPGQTIRYKGLCVDVDRQNDRYQTLAGADVTVVFSDPNGKEVERATHRTNGYGSFSGTFVAPRDRLLGAMTIRAEGAASGGTSVRVEEYKRPKFEVTLSAPRSAELDREVTIEGKAESYTGAPVDGGEVRFRVTREARYPSWWWSWYPRSGEVAQEIAHGTARTEADGGFAVTFLAKAAALDVEDDAVSFRFTVHADVVDPTGETRSASRTVNVGRVAMAASLSADPWQTTGAPVVLTLQTAILDGSPMACRGVLVVHRVEQPDRVERPALGGEEHGRWHHSPASAPQRSPADPAGWPDAEIVLERGVTVDTSGRAIVSVRLGQGIYRARFEARDRSGRRVRAEHLVRALDLDDRRFPIVTPSLLVAPKWSIEPGEEFLAVWGTGYERGRAFVEIEHRGKMLQAFWTAPGRTQVTIRQPVTEAMRGGFFLRVTFLRENRAYLQSQRIDVPWTNQRLAVRWEHFVSKLEPGQRETWSAVVTGPDATRAVAEMVATLYDASLDAYQPNGWPSGFTDFRHEHHAYAYSFTNRAAHLQHAAGHWGMTQEDESVRYRRYAEAIAWGGHGYGSLDFMRVRQSLSADAQSVRGGRSEEVVLQLDGVASNAAGVAMEEKLSGASVAPGMAGNAAPAPLAPVTLRTNLSETAFFFPHLVSSKNGEVRLEFSMPEALTQWRFLAFAHDRQMRAGLLEDRVVTARDLMVRPNPPRFLREGDELEFTVKVANRSAATQRGRVSLRLADARTGEPVDEAFGNRPEQVFAVPAMESRTFSFRLRVPDGAGFVTYKAVAASEKVADGEEGVLPVLSRRVLVTESLPLPIRGPRTRQFDFARLTGSNGSSTLRHQALTLQMTSHPAWYAVMALPYLMEYPYGCTEQTFNRLYANALAKHIATSNPRIRTVFDRWRGTPALDSPLEKNEDLKSVMLEETPWVRQAASESQARRNVGVLFEDRRLSGELARASQRMAELQHPDGSWPWFPGGPANEYVTLYVTTGYGRLRHLGVPVDIAPAIKSLEHLDRWMADAHRKILARRTQDENHLSGTVALYLYARSFFLEGHPVGNENRPAIDFWLGQARTHWLAVERQSQAHLALALARFGDHKTALDVTRSLAERAVHDEELGMFWRDLEHSWWWYHAPIETQAMMIEVFDEVANDRAAVEGCKVWLLKQKQTQDWKTTKATADAVYALILRGSDDLASDALVRVALAGRTLSPEKVEAGTGFYEHRVVTAEIRPEMGRVTVEKTDAGVAWGALHWQYLEDMTKVTPYEGTPLTLRKTLMRRQATKRGLELEPIAGPIAVGDELMARIEIRVDRDMEYVHLKDRRGSGVEPVNVLSGYRYQDGLGYYEQTRDTATHFFIAYLPKGTYLFEYPVRVQHRGRYQSGMAEIQCMYAPEFNSHSESVPIEVR